MANRHPASFAKRQREAAKRARRQEKAERKARRRAEKDAPALPPGEPTASADDADPEGETSPDPGAEEPETRG